MKTIVNSKNFDENFSKVLKEKTGKDFIKGRFDIEHLEIEEKNNFISHLILSSEIFGLTFKILTWDNNVTIQKFFESNSSTKFDTTLRYSGSETPGVIYIDDSAFDKNFLNDVLTRHFNYELARTPSLNIRIQLCVNYSNYLMLLDIYDDRGFDIYYRNIK